MVLKEGGLLSLCVCIRKEGGLLSLCVCIGVPLSLMVLEEDRLLRHQMVGVLMVLKEGGFLCVLLV